MAALSSTKERTGKKKNHVSIRLFKAIGTRPLRSCAEIIDRDATYILLSAFAPVGDLENLRAENAHRSLNFPKARSLRARKRETGEEQAERMRVLKRARTKRKSAQRSEREREGKKGEEKRDNVLPGPRATYGALAARLLITRPRDSLSFLSFSLLLSVPSCPRQRKFRPPDSLR